MSVILFPITSLYDIALWIIVTYMFVEFTCQLFFVGVYVLGICFSRFFFVSLKWELLTFTKFWLSSLYWLKKEAPAGHMTQPWCQDASLNLIWIYLLSRVVYCGCNRLIGLVGKELANGSRGLVSIPGRVIPNTFKMALDTSLLNTQQYKVRIEGKVEQSREKSSVLPYISV